MKFDRDTPDPVIWLMEEQKEVNKKGGTMRLGAQDCHIKENTLAARLYESLLIQERHRHRFEFNSTYRKQFEQAGLVISGTTYGENPLV